MREIEFKAKRFDNVWVYGSLVIGTDGKTVYIFTKEGNQWAVIPETICQYTGVHDDTEDENKIYLRDILKFIYDNDEVIGRVEYEAGSFIVVSDDLPDGYISFLELVDIDRDYWWIPTSKIIGNICENPKLVKRR